ncbi:energy transducer TonB [Nibricoccus aquaticus]|nr:energy transducer TonB [Nibricoccus aquaticus]
MKAFVPLATALAALICLNAHAAPPRKTSLEILSMANPPFPQHLSQRGILEGEAEVIVSINPDGRTADWLVTACTDPAFEQMAAEILPTLECRLPPSTSRNGPGRIKLHFLFETKGVIISQNASNTVDSLITRITPVRRINKLGTLRQLDHALILRHSVAPHYPESLHEAAGARVILEFLIDETGRVRMPVLHTGDNQLLAHVATDALLDWQFAPPTRAGQPVIVSARQEFVLPPK